MVFSHLPLAGCVLCEKVKEIVIEHSLFEDTFVAYDHSADGPQHVELDFLLTILDKRCQLVPSRHVFL